MVPVDASPRWHHRRVQDEPSALRLDPDEVAGAPVRLRLDWRTFAWLVLAVLTALAVLAVVRNTTTMLTRIGVGVVIALALDPVVDSIVRRWRMRRGFAVAVVAAAILGLAALLDRRPRSDERRARPASSPSSSRRPSTSSRSSR